MNEEILSGLRNALARGFSLEDSIQSFINAGYSQSEVKEAAYMISKGFSPLPSAQKEFVVSKAPEGAPFASKQDSPEQKPKSSSKLAWIVILIAVLIVLGIIIPVLLFPDRFLGVIDSIFP